MLDLFNSIFIKVATAVTGLLISVGLIAQPTPSTLPQIAENNSSTTSPEVTIVKTENIKSDSQNEQKENIAQLNKQIENLTNAVQNLEAEVKEKEDSNKAPVMEVVNNTQQSQDINNNPALPQPEPFLSINPPLNTQNALFLITASSSEDLKLQYLKFKISPEIFKSKLPKYGGNNPIEFSFAIERFNDPANLNPYDLSYQPPQKLYTWQKIFEKITKIELPAKLQAALYNNSGSCLDDITGQIMTCADLIDVWAERLSIVEFGGLSLETPTIPAGQTFRIRLTAQAKILECGGIEAETKSRVFCK
ncbi:MAG: hypothetical protein V2A55_02955 [Candidatus Jorgensenbacteria bacterium]